VPHETSESGTGGITFLENNRLPATFDFGEAGGWPKEATMFGLIVFALVILVLAAIAGPPYPQSWQSRWGNYDR
jgi:hypothetical protein